MRLQRSVVALTLLNLGISMVALARSGTVGAQGPPPLLRGRGLEIVDDQGRVRASISVLPAGTSVHGDRYAETVLLRLITERGRPSVKIGASEEAAGMSLTGPTGTKDTYIILEAKGRASSLKLRDESGREQVLRP
jgi:hypothetical protein